MLNRHTWKRRELSKRNRKSTSVWKPYIRDAGREERKLLVLYEGSLRTGRKGEEERREFSLKRPM